MLVGEWRQNCQIACFGAFRASSLVNRTTTSTYLVPWKVTFCCDGEERWLAKKQTFYAKRKGKNRKSTITKRWWWLGESCKMYFLVKTPPPRELWMSFTSIFTRIWKVETFLLLLRGKIKVEKFFPSPQFSPLLVVFSATVRVSISKMEYSWQKCLNQPGNVIITPFVVTLSRSPPTFPFSCSSPFDDRISRG